MSNLFFTYLENITTNFIVLFLTVFLASEWCFLYFGKLMIHKPYFRFEEKGVFSALNGVLLTVFSLYIGNRAPVFMLIISPSIIIVELILVSRDSFFSYFYYWIKILCNFISFYWIIVSILGLYSPKNVAVENVLPITIFLSGWWCFFLSKNSHYPIKELKLMVHNRKIGGLYFSFLAVCTVSLFFSTWVLRPVLMEDLADESRLQRLFFIEMLIKTTLIFLSGYLLLFMKAKEINQKENVRLLSLNLEKEEVFRRSTWQEAFLSFYVNISRNQIQEGRDLFTPLMWNDVNNYAEMLQKMAFYCVHPEDIKEFSILNKISTIEAKLRKNEHMTKQEMRVSPSQMLSFFNLPEKIKDLYGRTSDEWVWIKVTYVYTQDSDNGDIIIYVSIMDIHERKKKTEKLRQQATIDKLTGINNRAAFQQLIEERMASAARQNKDAGILILLDVDYFKSVNDLLGHPVGDQALQTVATALKEIFRSEDLVGRLGGDEFCVFINQKLEEETLRKRLSLVNEKCRKDYPVKGREPIHLSVSIGAALCTPEISAYDKLYELADKALYETKQKGKNGYTIYGLD